jgi:hypothetical protein
MKTTLPHYITERLKRPFEWGNFDCMLFVVGWVEIASGRNYLSQYPAWKNAKEAILQVDELGGLEAVFDAHFKRINPHLARDGDIALIDRTAFLFSGARIVSVGESGLVYVNRLQAKAAWRTPK